jgi:anti-sigma B factor antagonist
METTSFEVTTEVLDGHVHVFAPKLREPLERAIDAGADAVMVDLSRCEFIDSTGIALLVWAWQRLDSGRGGRITLCCPSAQVRRLLELTGVIEAIAIHRERDSAIASLRS